jgi:hypothetical protein
VGDNQPKPVHKAALRICEPHFTHKGAEAFEAGATTRTDATSARLEIDRTWGISNAGHS